MLIQIILNTAEHLNYLKKYSINNLLKSKDTYHKDSIHHKDLRVLKEYLFRTI
jgi:hypothetical protein